MYDSTETLANEKIDKNLKETIKAKNDSLLSALSNSDMKTFKTLGSPDFVKHLQGRIENAVWAFRKGYLKTDYEVYDEYYNKHGKAPNNSKIESEKRQYTFSFTNNAKETYISLLKTSYNNLGDYLITIIYEKIDGKWKLDYIHLDPLGQFGNNAQDYFDIAQQKEKEGFVIDAFFNVDIAGSCLTPAEKMLKYNNEERILFYQKTWQEQIKSEYKFPQPLRNISSVPMVAELRPINNREGMFPLFSYETKVPVEDTIILEMEFEEVKREIKRIYTGLDFDKKYIYYRAFNPGNYNNYHEFKIEK
ncbi:hypothetical protein DVK85_12710 [Flavobacterium arcticum]|uniref:Uncharacterized protein n=2 Tax=Flavobacterium arcticum TaxID=1784713 RepID=A0A345HEN2_9FLAO|nr:hypothetical protein DVK85_12710 [Flavobacterium arcticum]